MHWDFIAAVFLAFGVLALIGAIITLASIVAVNDYDEEDRR